MPRLFAGALEILPFDFVQRGPHQFSFFLSDLRQIHGSEKPQYEKELPHHANGKELSHYSDGETVDAEGTIVNRTSMPSSALFKLARLMRQDPILPQHLTPTEMGIVFSDFKIITEGGKIIKEFFLEFVPRGDRNQTYLQAGVTAPALTVSEAETVVAYLRRFVPRNIKIAPRLDGHQRLTALDIEFPA